MAVEVGRPRGGRGGFGAFRVSRLSEERILTGAAAGLADSLGLDANLVRAGFVVLAFAGGFGIVAYLLVALASRTGEPRGIAPLPGARQVAAVATIVGGALILLREAGLWLGDAIVWPVSLAALGASVLWVRSDEPGRGRAFGPADVLFERTSSPVRLAIGVVLIVLGIGSFLVAVDVLAAARTFVIPVLATIAGLSLVFGPWLWRLAQDLVAERRQRIRSEERSEVAAHLHDSVLQTLALIQRTNDPRTMSSLARVQERELRNWLYGEIGSRDEKTLEGAIDGLAARIESMHRVAVHTVVVGDAVLDDGVRALVQGCGEALVNSAKHSGAQAVSLFVEAAADGITAYVRDEGVGFDPDDVPEDRRGIAESIVARMERVGGSTKVVSAPGKGAEIQLSLPKGLR